MAGQIFVRMVHYRCPVCGQRHRIGLLREPGRCRSCGQAMRLVPGMFDRAIFVAVFIAGAVGVGVMLGRLRMALGGLPYGGDQLMLDLMCFWIYAWISRVIFFQFQTLTVCP